MSHKREEHFPSPTSDRILSVDVFRGGLIVIMILANNFGDTSTLLPLFQLNTEWYGWVFTDMVFPSFLWVVGIALALALTRRRNQGDPRRQLLLHTVRRAGILFAIGLVLASIPAIIPALDFPELANLRVPGLLQRIALCYLLASLVVLWLPLPAQVLGSLAFLGAYWLLLLLVPVPGVGAGSLEQGHNFANYVDQVVLGSHAKTADPLGIVGTLSATSITLWGVFTGYVLLADVPQRHKLAWIAIAGVILLVAGVLVQVWVPVIAPLWTPSFNLLVAGADLLVFAACYSVVDSLRYRTWAFPLIVFGSNAIAIFVLDVVARKLTSWLPIKTPIYEALFAPLGSPQATSFLFAIAWLGMMYVIAYTMYQQRWFFKI